MRYSWTELPTDWAGSTPARSARIKTDTESKARHSCLSHVMGLSCVAVKQVGDEGRVLGFTNTLLTVK